MALNVCVAGVDVTVGCDQQNSEQASDSGIVCRCEAQPRAASGSPPEGGSDKNLHCHEPLPHFALNLRAKTMGM